MQDVFLKLLNMSITAGWLVLAVVGMRFLLKKAPRWITVALWGVVALRLILPVSFESTFSLIPSAQTVPSDIVSVETPTIDSGIPVINSVVNPILSDSLAPVPGDSVTPLQVLTFAATAVWGAGMVVMILYALVSYLRIHRKVREAALLRDNIWVCDHIGTPFILGCFRPRIYLPSDLSEGDAEFVIAHEAAHLKRRDHLWKPFGFLLLTVYWFNPLLWVAYVLLCRDIEQACDEKVLRERGNEIKKDYSDALIHCSVPRKMVSACPLAFGEVGVKERVKSVLNYKKPAFWIILVALAACIVLSVCFLTDPIRLSDPMKVFIDCQLAEHNSSGKEEGTGFLDYEVLDIDRLGHETTVYMWVLWESYQCENGALKLCSGSHMFTVMTMKDTESGYELVELWEPRDGTYWASDIREKVPWYLFLRATDSQRYIEGQKEKVVRMAEEYFGLSEPTVALGNTLLKKMEDLTLDSIFRNTTQIMVEYGGAYKVNLSFSSSDVIALGNLEISATRVSDSLSETRDKTHTIVLQTAEDIDPKMSNVPGLHLHFNKDFTEVWADGNLVKPTHSYKVADPQKARTLFEKLAESSQSPVGGVSGPENVTGTQEPTLREMFPQYFDLPVIKGLQVYVWQMAPSQFYCGLLPGRNLGYTQEEIEALKPATIDQMRQIVENYGLPKERITIIPINHSLSSYYYTVDDAYIERVNNLFWWGAFSANGSLLFPVIDEVRCDLDGDGKEETVTLLPGPTSGLLTYTIAVSRNSALVPGEPLECSTVFYPSGGSGWESDFSLEKTEDGRCLLKGLSGKEQEEVYYNITCADGQIACSKIQD